MKIMVAKWLFISIIYFSFLPVNIVNAQDTMSLSFHDALDIAMVNNVNLYQQKNNLEINKATKLQSKGSFLPNIGITASGTNSQGRQFNTELGQMVNTNVNNISYTVSVTYPLFNGFMRLNTLRQANYQYDAQYNVLQQTKQNVIYNTANQYLQILLDKELIKITKENLTAQKVVLEQIKGYVDVEIKAVSDQYTQEAQVNLLEVQLMKLQNQLISDKATLKVILMLDENTDFDLTIPEWGIDNTILKNVEIDSLWEIAKNKRNDLIQLKNNNKASEYGIKIAKAAKYPSLQAYYNFSSGYNDSYKIDDEIVGFNRQIFKDNPYHVIGLKLSIPVFNGFQTRTNIISSKVNHLNNISYYESYEKSIYSQLQTAINGFLTVKESYKASISGYNAAKLSFEKQTERFKLGIGNIVEYTQSSQSYIQAQANRAQAEYSLLFQKIILDYYTGILSSDELYY